MQSSGWRESGQPGEAQVKLAQQRPFKLGLLDVQPAACRVAREGESEALEPRVMQVLVALAEAEGEVVSREDLVARCWQGRVVGENAINRVISRVRALGAGLGAGSYRVETITKVGYRLIVESAHAERAAGAVADAPGLLGPLRTAAPDAPGAPGAATSSAALIAQGAGPAPLSALHHPPLVARRVLVGGAAVAAVGLALVGWQAWNGRPSPEAAALYRKGVEAQRQGLAEQNVQAAAFFRQAVDRDPDFAAAWGALALAHRHLLEAGDTQADPATRAAWVTSAAATALRLEPGNADAQVALILIKPYFRNWTLMEHELRAALRDHPDHWLLWGNLGRILGEVGRWKEAIEPLERALSLDPFLPIARGRQAVALWSCGRLQQAQSAFEAAAGRWPAHPSIWFARFHFLALTGQAPAALALAGQTASRPVGVPADEFAALSTLARLLDTRQADGGSAAGAAEAATASLATGTAVMYLAALGRIDTAFQRLDRYFFGSGSGSGSGTNAGTGASAGAAPTGPLPAPGPLTRRYTDFLFMPPTAALRADRRFAALADAIGLQDYWRAANARPDHLA